MLKITESEITAFSNYILDISGIYLDYSKGYLLETRLKSLLDEVSVTTFSALLNQIKGDQSQRLRKKLIDAISTNETFFFRDNVPFDLMRNKIIPDIIDLKRKRYSTGPIPLKIWSAACSTGQEVYSIIMTLVELQLGMGTFENTVLGTDISGEAVARASYGEYNSFEVERGLSPSIRPKYFRKTGAGWRIKDEIRSMARFETMNLMKPFPANINSFDIVFCRNVAIYFQNNDKIMLFRKIARSIAPGGALIVGGSESLSGMAPDFVNQQYLKSNYYTLKIDQNIRQQTERISTPKTVHKVKKAPSVKRPTVYDRKLIKSQAPVFENTNDIKPPSVDLNQKVPEVPTPIVETPLIQEKQPEVDPEKISLLSSLQHQKNDQNSFIDRKTTSKNTTKSLLSEIAKRNEKENE